MRPKFIFIVLLCLSLLVISCATVAKEPVTDETARRINEGNSYSEQGVYDKAISEYSAAIELEPTSEVTYFVRGKAYYFNTGYLRAASEGLHS